MNASTKEIFAVQFASAIARLKALGLKGEVAVVAGAVMVSTNDKYSASSFRKAIKTACANTGAVHTENRPAKGSYVFSIVV